ncbi:SIS domain-containing protein [Rhizobium sp. P38BS-XIX]|uniref:SIS domain-containing protein n=1 Tax=Rhizobium sp. P38BS-XIX TaxID=2726740 RepID=UPI001456C67B|nr:SIS domain-containing protein [Rhizobium sp. P38BS-XIX]NLR97681.1 SIS domain-containing protein [Rhizobium sp. P38BS-XIX]
MPKGYIPLAVARASQAEALAKAITRITEDVRLLQSRGALQGPGPIFLGIGASFAASAAAVWTLRSRNIHGWRLNAGEHPLPFPHTPHPLIGVSQSGKSSETLAVLNTVEQEKRFSVVNAVSSPIEAISAVNISLGNIPDSYASTIGYTATVAALGMISEAWDGGVIDDTWTDLSDAFRAVETVLSSRISTLIAPMQEAQYVDCVGAAPSTGSAEVGALLLREIARIPSTGMSTRQYLHGAMESAGRGVHIIFGEERELQLAQKLARAGHDVILVSPLDVAEESHLAHVAIPSLTPAQRPIVEALVMQTIAVETAIARGLDPDSFVFENNDTKVA